MSSPRKLGLLKRKSSTLVTNRPTKKKSTGQQFSYLLILDFESTCWREKKAQRWNEIIEFPAVLLDTTSGEIIDEFQQYVRPTENSKLSEFCTNLTGITQETVDGGVGIDTCLKMFDEWIQKLKEKNICFEGEDYTPGYSLCAVMTWTDWDLNVCLQWECRRKKIRHPSYLRCWIDLKKYKKEFYKNKKNVGLRLSMEELGLSFEGKEHSGIDDARNTAKLAWKMIKDGAKFAITKST